MKKILAIAMFALALLAAPAVEAGRAGGARVGFRPVPVRPGYIPPVHRRPIPVPPAVFRRRLLRDGLTSCHSFRYRRWSSRWRTWMFYHPIRGWFFYAPVVGVYVPVQYIVYLPPTDEGDTPGDAMELPVLPSGNTSV